MTYKAKDDLISEVQEAINGNYIYVDLAYRRFWHEKPCFKCESTYGTLGHHLKHLVNRGNKSKDCFIVPLCASCHTGDDPFRPNTRNVEKIGDRAFFSYLKEVDIREVAWHLNKIWRKIHDM